MRDSPIGGVRPARPIASVEGMTLSLGGGLVAVIAVAVTLISLIALHIVPTGLSPFRDPVSQYGISAFRALYATAAISAGIAGIGVIVAVAGIPGSIATVILLAVFSAARIAIPFFPMDSPDGGATRTGRFHNVLAFLAFGSVTAAAFVAAGMLHDAGFPTTALLSTAFGVVMAVGAVVMLISRLRERLRAVFGAAERLIYVGFIGWFITIGVTALV